MWKVGSIKKCSSLWYSRENISVLDSCRNASSVKISKLNYLNRQLNAIQDDNIEEQTIAFKKQEIKKTYVTAQRLAYTKSVRELHKKFMELSGIDCSYNLFYKYKPILHYSTYRARTAKLSLHQMSNSYLLLKGVNSYRKNEKFVTTYFCHHFSTWLPIFETFW